MPKWTVNDWYQIEWDGNQLTGGDTFSADAEDVASQGLTQYVSRVEEPVKEKAAEPSENKAQAASPNKAKTAAKRTTKK